MSTKNEGVGFGTVLGLCLVTAAAVLGYQRREELADMARPIIKDLNKQVGKIPPMFKNKGIFTSFRGK